MDDTEIAVRIEAPHVAVVTPDGAAFKTTGLRGHYTVLVFGCLT